MFRSTFHIPISEETSIEGGAAAGSESPVPSDSVPQSSSETGVSSVIDSIETNDLLFLQLLSGQLEIPQRNLPEKFGVQDQAPRGNRHADQGAPYILGTGATCTVVQHETTDDTSDIIPSGTLVALKIYKRQIPPAPSTDRDLAHVIWQDLRTLCHPQFREHENFCRLLFIGWHDYTVVPSLAMELAAYGTLRDALESEPTLSWLQKCHICLDITVGLFTMHSCGFIHGDIKPENIMIQHHPARKVVAKLLDFAGATEETRFGSGRHRRFMSKLWYPAEALSDPSHVDWRKIDCYSYGMIMTHIFCTIDFKRLDCYLLAFIPDECTIEAKNDLLIGFKTRLETENDSVMSHSMALAKKHSKNPRSQDIMIPLELIQQRTLAVDPRKRADLSEILPHFRHFTQAHQRKVPLHVDFIPAVQKDQQALEQLSRISFFVLSKEFENRTKNHQAMLLQYMIEISSPPVLTLEYFDCGNEEDFLEPKALVNLLEGNESLSPPPMEYYKRKLHYQIALCYFMGRGCKVNERSGLRYLASAALGKVQRAMNMYNSVEYSTMERSIDWEIPRRLLLCVGFLGGCTICADTLAKQYAVTHTALAMVLRACDEPLWRQTCPPSESVSPQPDIDIKAEDRIFQAIELGDMPALLQLLQSEPEINLTHSSGITALHSLSLIPDQTAAQMAWVLLRHGADLTLEATEKRRPSTNEMYFGWGTPVVWAIVKSRSRLFAAFVDWCIETHQELPAGKASIFTVTVTSREPQMLRKLIESKHAFEIERKDMDSRAYQTLAARLAVETFEDRTIMRRWALGGRYRSARREIAQLLVGMGIDVLDRRIRTELDPVSFAIRNGDAVCLEVYANSLHSQEHALPELFGRNGLLKMGAEKEIYWSALIGSIQAPSLEATYYLVASFPDLINQSSVSGWTPLMYAIHEGDHEAAAHLLDHGADMYHRNGQGSNALVISLAHNAIKTASELMSRDNKAFLLGRPSDLGRSAFDLVLSTFMSGRKQIRLDSFAFLHKMGSLEFVLDPPSQEKPWPATVWWTIFAKGRPYFEEHIVADIRLLRFLLRQDIFGSKVNEFDWTGQTALHNAARQGYIEAVELFLESGALVNIECQSAQGPDDATHNNEGWNPIDFALYNVERQPPEHILAGGAIEVRFWQDRNTRIVKLLHERGEWSGSGAPWSYSEKLWEMMNADQGLVIDYGVNDNAEEWTPRWPERIPQDVVKDTVTIASGRAIRKFFAE